MLYCLYCSTHLLFKLYYKHLILSSYLEFRFPSFFFFFQIEWFYLGNDCYNAKQDVWITTATPWSIGTFVMNLRFWLQHLLYAEQGDVAHKPVKFYVNKSRISWLLNSQLCSLVSSQVFHIKGMQMWRFINTGVALSNLKLNKKSVKQYH